MHSGFLAPILADATRHHSLVSDSGRLIAARILPAFDSATRRTGLLHHASLAPDTVMIIAPCSSIHTFFMKFAIDVAFVDRSGRVTKVCPAIAPWRLAFGWRAFAVIEGAEHTFSKALRVGDRVKISSGTPQV